MLEVSNRLALYFLVVKKRQANYSVQEVKTTQFIRISITAVETEN